MSISKFGFGLIAGFAAGMAVSLFKDENGQRLGAPLKRDLESFQHDAMSLLDGINKAKQASADLMANMPAAERAISDIGDDVHHYEERTAPIINNIKRDADEVDDDLEDPKSE